MNDSLVTYSAIRFRPNLKHNIWGGTLLPRIKGVDADGVPVGESWEVSAMPGSESIVDGGALDGCKLTDLCDQYGTALLGTECVRRYGFRFPLLAKFIDANHDLSLQVHPDDVTAERLHGSDAGKSEMWYIVAAKPGASVTLGFRGKVARSDFENAAGSENILQMVQKYATAPGKAFMIPAGTIHSIGAGNFLAEIQQSSDLTYRVFDFNRPGSDGRPRKLHLSQACEAVNLEAGNSLVLMPCNDGAGGELLVRSEHFTVRRLTAGADGIISVPADSSSFRVLMCLDGSTLLPDGSMLTPGNSVLVPACAPGLHLRGQAVLLQASV